MRGVVGVRERESHVEREIGEEEEVERTKKG